VRQTLTLGRLCDIRVRVHISWIAVYAFVTYVLADGLTMLPRPQAYLVGAVCALALFASVVVHELAHALVARRFGVRTDAITLFLFGGVALFDEEPMTPRGDALIALAGPALSGALAVVATAALILLDRFAGPGAELPALLVAYLAVANGVLAVFNLIPAYPMDGGRVLRALLWRRSGDLRRATQLAARVGIGFACAFVVVGLAVVAATHEPIYAWYAVLGAFLARQGWLQERAAREPVPAAIERHDVEVGAAA
jgi:Zn-dependent protease